MDKKEHNMPPEEELLKEYELALKVGNDVVPQPAPDEFERIWKRIQEVKENEEQ